MNAKQLTLARDAEAKLQAAVEACEILAEFERTNEVSMRVAFTQLPRERVDQWRARLDATAEGARTAEL